MGLLVVCHEAKKALVGRFRFASLGRSSADGMGIAEPFLSYVIRKFSLRRNMG